MFLLVTGCFVEVAVGLAVGVALVPLAEECFGVGWLQGQCVEGGGPSSLAGFYCNLERKFASFLIAIPLWEMAFF